jgi:hypothetical protein
VHGPARVSEVALQLAEDGRHGVGREGRAAGRVEAVDRLHEADRGDLHEVVERLVGPLVAACQLARQGQEALDQLLARGGVSLLVVAEQQTSVLAGALEPAFLVELVRAAGHGLVDDGDELEILVVLVYFVLGRSDGLTHL